MSQVLIQQRQHIVFVLGKYSHARLAECIESLTENFSLTICCGHRQAGLSAWSQNHSIAVQYFQEDPKVPGYLQGLERVLADASVIMTADLFSASSFQALDFARKHSRPLYAVSEYLDHQFLAEAPNLRLVLQEFLTRANGIVQPSDIHHWRTLHKVKEDSVVMTLSAGLKPVSMTHWRERQLRFRSWLKVGQDEVIHTHVCDDRDDDFGQKLLRELSTLAEETRQRVRILFVDEGRLTDSWKYLAADLKVGSRVFFLHDKVDIIWSDLLCATDRISWSKGKMRSALEESDAISHGAAPLLTEQSLFGSMTETLPADYALAGGLGSDANPHQLPVYPSNYENRAMRAETLLQAMGATHKVRATLFLNEMIKALGAPEDPDAGKEDFSWLLQIAHRMTVQDFQQQAINVEEFRRLKTIASLEVHHDLRVLAKAKFLVGRMMETGGQYSEAMAWYESSIKAAEGQSSSVIDDSLLRLGGIALRLQSYDEATALFKSVLARDPGNAEACLGFGVGCLHSNLLEDCALWLEKACHFAATRDRAICCLVSLLNRPAMIYQAAKCYERLLDYYPEEPRLVLGYSRYLDLLGDSKGSESILNLLQTFPNR